MVWILHIFESYNMMRHAREEMSSWVGMKH